MNTYEIKNISVKRTVDMLINAVAFNLHVTSETEETAEAGWMYDYETPVPVSQEFTDAEILSLCEAIAAEKNMYSNLDNILLRRSATLVGIGNPNTPINPAPPPLTDAEQVAVMMANIDSNVAIIYERYQRFQLEYMMREAAALAFKAAGYAGEPTVWISHFATNAGLSLTDATDLILSQATNYRSAIEKLGMIRMDKYKVLHALTIDEARTEYGHVLTACADVEKTLV